MADENDWVGKENERIARRRDKLGVTPPEVGKGETGKRDREARRKTGQS